MSRCRGGKETGRGGEGGGGRGGVRLRCEAAAALPELMDLATVAKYSTAGAVGCIISHSGSVPLDVVKTRVQLDPEKFAGMSTMESAEKLVAEEGMQVLLGGLGSTALGYSIHGALKYGGFEFLKYAMVHHGGGVEGGSHIALFTADHRLAALMIAGMTAEFIASLLLCPLEQTRIKMVSDPNYAPNVVAAMARLLSEEGEEEEEGGGGGGGLSGVMSSLPAIWTKTVPYSMVQLSVYDVTSSALREAAAYAAASGALGAVGLTTLPKVFTQLPSSLLAAFFASLVSQPGDTLLSTMNKQEGGSGRVAGETTIRTCVSAATATAGEEQEEEMMMMMMPCVTEGAPSSSSYSSSSTTVLERVEVQAGTVVVVDGAPKVSSTAAPAVRSDLWGEEQRVDEDEAAAAAAGKKQNRRRKGLVDLAAELGPAGLMVGWKERFAHVVSIIIIQLLCYDYIKQSFGLLPA